MKGLIGTDVSDFEHVIRGVAGSCLSAGAIDGSAADQDDYANEMRIAAWRALQRHPDQPLYIKRAVQNAAKELIRSGARRKRQPQTADPGEDTVDPFPQLEARSRLRGARLQKKEVDMLQRLMFSGPPAHGEPGRYQFFQTLRGVRARV